MRRVVFSCSMFIHPCTLCLFQLTNLGCVYWCGLSVPLMTFAVHKWTDCTYFILFPSLYRTAEAQTVKSCSCEQCIMRPIVWGEPGAKDNTLLPVHHAYDNILHPFSEQVTLIDGHLVQSTRRIHFFCLSKQFDLSKLDKLWVLLMAALHSGKVLILVILVLCQGFLGHHVELGHH